MFLALASLQAPSPACRGTYFLFFSCKQEKVGWGEYLP